MLYENFRKLKGLLWQCVISSVLSHHKKNLKWQTLQLSDRPCFRSQTNCVTALGQVSVTAQFYLENKGKYILKAWGHTNPKDVSEWESLHGQDQALWFVSPFICFFLPPGLPYVTPASQECCLFYLRSSDPWTFFCSISQTFPFPVF